MSQAIGSGRLERRVRGGRAERQSRGSWLFSLFFFPFGSILSGAAIAPYGPNRVVNMLHLPS